MTRPNRLHRFDTTSIVWDLIGVMVSTAVIAAMLFVLTAWVVR
jgi:hypothetical protein